MNMFTNLKVKNKMRIVILVSQVLMLTIAGISLKGTNELTDRIEKINTYNLIPAIGINEARSAINRIRIAQMWHVLAKDKRTMEEQIMEIQKDELIVNNEIAKYEPIILTNSERALFNQLKTVWPQFQTHTATVIKLSAAGRKDEALADLMGPVEVKAKEIVLLVQGLVEECRIQGEEFHSGAVVEGESIWKRILLVLGIVMAVGFLLSWFVGRQVSDSLAAVAAVAHRAAEGDLTARVRLGSKDDIGQLSDAFDVMLEKLAQVIRTVRRASYGVSTGATQVNAGSQDLSHRTSTQASALEETSAAMEEMTSTVKQNADNAKQAEQLANVAREVAGKGGAITERAVNAMSEINKSSKKIVDIIAVIDEIAFQINLLALNAAVEAARAGEHGRGFAVVAGEVRNLAQRSATAAKEIKSLINESVQKVTDGSELVNQSGKTLEEIVKSVKRVTDIIAEISAASQEQAGGIDQVNKAIVQIDETTQNNAALVEETAAAAQSMQDQAAELLREVETFKISTGEEQVADHSGHRVMRVTSGTQSKPFGKSADHTLSSNSPVWPAGQGGKLGEPKEPVGVASGNGKDRRRKEDEFVEF